jgi:2-polyprenyl-6-methoxyphenol hydroxylase-like FAD-dependent oxidoreductase
MTTPAPARPPQPSTDDRYDAIVVGGRSAGAATALLLARRGRRVLALDRAMFPDGDASSQTIQPSGVARLARWGLLERISATGVPFASRVHLDVGGFVVDGIPTPVDGIDAAVCMRRSDIDSLLAGAAAEAGADVRLGATVTDLLFDGDRVVGVAGHDSAGRKFEDRAAIVVGADGANSFVARTVAAPTYDVRPAATLRMYSHWRGLAVEGIEQYLRPGRFFVVAPTCNGLTLIAQQIPAGEAAAVRARVGEAFVENLAAVPDLAARVAAAERVEPFVVDEVGDSFFRQPSGPGWTLVGDASYHQDPITAQGIADAFRDAEVLAAAIDEGLDGDLAGTLLSYQRARDAAALPMAELTAGLAALEVPAPEFRDTVAALGEEQLARFLGVITGSVSIADFYTATAATSTEQAA